ncbi:hypothetical protein ERX46_17120 [Brumimicrobium glaciale]|uniref:Uncharacterized protein n=1 Tax=Brumimicrobium glaciale TaxID=200475 RepID=A0A4Q4KCS0_9FLAO|nr:hypothetical protein [Brumimicrobium glaciale]RYM30802.1 hypothetical protein ERX46_17120 [Brumimicrobium glaciale]
MIKGKIEVIRINQMVNFGRGIKLFINNEKVAKIQDGESQTFELNLGENEIYAQIDWFKTNPLKIIIKENELFRLELGSNLKGKKLLFSNYSHYSLFKRSEFLYLKQIDSVKSYAE